MGALVGVLGLCVCVLGLVCLNLCHRLSRLEDGIQQAADLLKEPTYV